MANRVKIFYIFVFILSIRCRQPYMRRKKIAGINLLARSGEEEEESHV